MEEKILAIDPSSTSIGWALFIDKKLIKYGCIKPRGDNILEKMQSMYESFNYLLDCNKVIIEINTSPFTRNIKRINLYQMFVGATIGYFLGKKKVELVEVRKWKKNLSEKQIGYYAKTYYKPDTNNPDTLTAIWLGHVYLSNLF